MSAITTISPTASGPEILTILNDNFDAINGDLVDMEADIVTLQGRQPTNLDASTTVKGITKISVAPVSATEPIFVGTNDPRIPNQGENDALAGSSGTPNGTTNKYVTANDPLFTGTIKTTGNQTIDGIKTFSSIPVLPASDPTTSTQAVRLSYALNTLTTSTGSVLLYSTTVRLYYTKIGKTYTNLYINNQSSNNKMIAYSAGGNSNIATRLGITIASYSVSPNNFTGSKFAYSGVWSETSPSDSSIVLFSFKST